MRYVIPMIVFLCFLGCRKKKEDPIPCTQHETAATNTCRENRSFYPLTKGSYWIYECSNYFADTDTRTIYRYDSCYIMNKDTVINGFLFAIRATANYQAPPSKNYLRFDESYLIAWPNYKLFSACNTNQIMYTYYDPSQLYFIEYRSTDKDTLHTVPAGSFSARIVEHRYMFPSASSNGFGQYYAGYTMYAKNIGMVYETISYMYNPLHQDERRLVRYHIE